VPGLIAIVGALAWPLAGKILLRKRHERQQGGLARAAKPTACSSRAVVPVCLLAVSEGRTTCELDGSPHALWAEALDGEKKRP